VWPLVLALVVGVPAAVGARREPHEASVVSCVVSPIADSPRICTVREAGSLGAPAQVACALLPTDLDRILGPQSPLSRPLIHATEPVPPPITPQRDGACVADEPPRSPSSVPGGTHVVDVDTARRLVRQYAGASRLAPGARSIAVFERDYARSALVLLAAFGLALVSMFRRRATVTTDGTTLAIVERGFFRARRTAVVPISDVDVVTIAVGASGPLVGRRVELACRSGERIPVVEAFTSFGARAHALTRARIAELVAPMSETTEHRAPALPRRATVAVVALGACLTLLMIGVTASAALRVLRSGPLRTKAPESAQPARLLRTASAREGSTVVLASLRGRSLALVADEDARAVRAVDAPRVGASVTEPEPKPLEDVLTAKLASAPGAMILDERGRLFVTLPLESAIAVLDIASGQLREARRLATATEPIGLAITPDERTLVVVSNFGHALETFRLEDLAPGISVDLPRSPRALTLSASGREAIIAHATESTLTRVDLGSGASTSTSLDTTVKLPLSSRLRIDRGRSAVPATVRSPLRQARIARVGDRLFVPGVIATAGDTSRPAKDGYYDAVNPVESFTMFKLDSPEASPRRSLPTASFLAAAHRPGHCRSAAFSRAPRCPTSPANGCILHARDRGESFAWTSRRRSAATGAPRGRRRSKCRTARQGWPSTPANESSTCGPRTQRR
jgi:hypothetical protein